MLKLVKNSKLRIHLQLECITKYCVAQHRLKMKLKIEIDFSIL